MRLIACLLVSLAVSIAALGGMLGLITSTIASAPAPAVTFVSASDDPALNYESATRASAASAEAIAAIIAADGAEARIGQDVSTTVAEGTSRGHHFVAVMESRWFGPFRWLAATLEPAFLGPFWWVYALQTLCLLAITFFAVASIAGAWTQLPLSRAAIDAVCDWAINAPTVLGVVGTIVAFAGMILGQGGVPTSSAQFGAAFFDAAATTVVGGLVYVLNMFLVTVIARDLDPSGG